MAFWRVLILAMSSSGISNLALGLENSSSMAMTSSTRSRESALRSSTKEASGTTWDSSAPSCSVMTLVSRCCTVANSSPPLLGFFLEGRVSYRAEDAVDKAGGGVRAKGLGQLHSLVDSRLHGHPTIIQDFKNCQPQDVPVQGSKLLQGKDRGQATEGSVYLPLVLQDPLHQLPGKEEGFRGESNFLGQALHHLLGVMVSQVHLVEGLQHRLPGLPPGSPRQRNPSPGGGCSPASPAAGRPGPGRGPAAGPASPSQSPGGYSGYRRPELRLPGAGLVHSKSRTGESGCPSRVF